VNSWKNPRSTTDFICTESADKLDFFLKFSLSHKLQLLNVQRNICLVMCYTTNSNIDFIDFRIYYYNHLINLNKRTVFQLIK